MHIMKRTMALCLSLLVLMMTAAGAEVSFLDHAQDWETEMPPLEVLLSAKVTAHQPFDADRLAMLTPITDALSLRLVTGTNAGSVGILLADEPLLTLTYHGSEAQLSCVPDTTYQAADDPLTALLGADVSVTDVYALLGLNRDGETLIADGRVLLDGIQTALADYGTRSASTQSISGYGQATYRYDYTVPASRADALTELLLPVCSDGWLRSIIARLTFSGKQTLRIYYTGEDKQLRAEYNGVCGFGDDLRTVNLVFKQLHNGETDKDYLELTSPAKKGKNKNSLTFERTLTTNKKGQRTLEGSYSYTVTADGITSVRKGEFALNNAFTADADVLTGSMTFQTRLDGAEKYSAVTLKPDLTLTGTAEAPVVEGTITVEESFAGKTTEAAVVSVSLKRADGIAWADSFYTVDLSLLSAEEMADLTKHISESATTALVRPLIRHMGAQGDWFFREMPENAVHAILDAAGATQSTKEAE